MSMTDNSWAEFDEIDSRGQTLLSIIMVLSLMAVVVFICLAVFSDEEPDDKVQLENTESISWKYDIPNKNVVIIQEGNTLDDFDPSQFSTSQLIKLAIYTRGEEEGLDGLLMVAISRFETGNFTSVAFVDYYNFCGITVKSGVCSYASFEDGLDAFVNLMKWYQEKGMTTPATMAKTYCPPNSRWPDEVTRIMNEELNDPVMSEYYEYYE